MSKPTNFFLVDDDSDDNFLFEEALESVAPTVTLTSASNGQEAIDALDNLDVLPDLIFLDLNMPVMDGKECLGRIKSDDKLREIPVIMYTTSSQSSDIEETLQRGAMCFITKPTSIKELKKILTVITSNASDNLLKALQNFSNNASTFIVC